MFELESEEIKLIKNRITNLVKSNKKGRKIKKKNTEPALEMIR